MGFGVAEYVIIFSRQCLENKSLLASKYKLPLSNKTQQV